jgi:hypothetical protein
MMDRPVDPSAVVSLEGWRKRREREKAKESPCTHERYILDVEHGTVNCAECDAPVSAFFALKKIAFRESQAFQKLHSMNAEIAAITARRSWLSAVKTLDRIWRGKKMLPCCPHCNRGLFAEDFRHAAVGVEYEKARRAKEGTRVPRDDNQAIDASHA